MTINRYKKHLTLFLIDCLQLSATIKHYKVYDKSI